MPERFRLYPIHLAHGDPKKATDSWPEWGTNTTENMTGMMRMYKVMAMRDSQRCDPGCKASCLVHGLDNRFVMKAVKLKSVSIMAGASRTNNGMARDVVRLVFLFSLVVGFTPTAK